MTQPSCSLDASGTASVAWVTVNRRPVPASSVPSTSAPPYPATAANPVATRTPVDVSTSRTPSRLRISESRASALRSEYSRTPIVVSPASVTPCTIVTREMTVTYWPKLLTPRWRIRKLIETTLSSTPTP